MGVWRILDAVDYAAHGESTTTIMTAIDFAEISITSRANSHYSALDTKSTLSLAPPSSSSKKALDETVFTPATEFLSNYQVLTPSANTLHTLFLDLFGPIHPLILARGEVRDGGGILPSVQARAGQLERAATD